MISAVVVAGGSGTRMKATVRKQYLRLKDRPVLAQTLKAVDACGLIDEIILVVPKEDIDFCRQQITGPLTLSKAVRLVAGGKTRQMSVYHGLMAIKDESGLVVIHDGVRPFVRPEQFVAGIEVADECGACILAVPADDTLKSVKKNNLIEKTVDRQSIWQAQTPQTFRTSLIKEAHELAVEKGIVGSDDALLVERAGRQVRVIKGSKYNIKITTREDLLMAEAIIGSGEFRF